MKLGFVGLGVMGTPMALHLIRGGHEVFLHSRTRVPGELLGQGGIACASAAEVGLQSEMLFTMLPDTPDVASVLFGDGGFTQSPLQGKTLIDMSSISPSATRRFAGQLAELGAAYLDAPVSGGEVGAKAASLTIMVGGEQSVFDKALPILALMGKNITRIGDVGSGQIAKISNQIVVALTILAVAEGLVFASKAGADPAIVRQALMGGLATSRILELHGERMIRRTFQPGFRIALHQKDLNLALSHARTLGLPLPATAAVQEMFSLCAAHGGTAWDHSAIIRALEIMANHHIGGDDADASEDH